MRNNEFDFEQFLKGQIFMRGALTCVSKPGEVSLYAYHGDEK